MSDITGTDLQTIVFQLGEGFFGVDIFRVNEIIRVPEISDMSCTKGYVNLRGNSIPVLDLKVQFNIGNSVESDRTRIIILSSCDGTVGVLVDAVHEVITLTVGDINETPISDTEFVKGVARHHADLITILDLDKVLAA
ncbi:MAG: chemotaxis protein CheW [Armatimonadetes bacterium]|nr:chemotaxis protein CheW [Armatimonadota bacterium]